MSYEGHVQAICANGHLMAFDAYEEEYGRSEAKCHCGANPVWRNHVDDTNCDSYGEIRPHEFDKLKIADEVKCQCPCGHWHIKEQARYRVPTEEEVKQMRSYWDGQHWHKEG